ncbi:MEDS domain-containing protein [Streptomyces xanthochromogenes]|uniref:MEDS domain-containing protein n=1 Tax=Streptomyces xanthochromogenes TaxID=67384 RepID=UPI0038095D31
MSANRTRERPIDDVGHGDHLCLAFADDAEQRRVVTSYLQVGLDRGERVLYFADQNTPGQVLNWLREAGTDPAAALDSGQLTVTTADDSYLADGPFDADAMVTALHKEVSDCLAAGYTGLRVSGEMSWALRDIPGADRLDEYERKVNAVFAGHAASAICQYDARRFDAASLHSFDRRHPAIVAPHPLFTSPSLDLVPSLRNGQQALRVIGDVDYHSFQAFSSALESILDWPGDLTVDMNSLQFIDLAGMRALVRTAERLRAGRRLHVVDLDPMLCEVMHVVGWDQIPSLSVTAREALA